jgi:hypothetical protein
MIPKKIINSKPNTNLEKLKNRLKKVFLRIFLSVETLKRMNFFELFQKITTK